MSFVAAAVSVASLGMGVASAAGAFTPSQPNLGAASAQMANLQAEQLPIMAQLQAEAQLGGTANLLTPKQQAQIAKLQSAITQATAAGQRAGAGEGGKNAAATAAKIASLNQQITKIQGAHPNSFAGYSTADIQRKLLGEQAAGQLANAQKYDAGFIDSAAKQEAQANPQGVAARGQLYKDIQSQIANPPQSPVAETMNKQVGERVAAGSGLTPEEQAVLDASVNNTVTGTSGNTPNFGAALTTGFEGQARQAGNDQAGAAWLASGNTPGDIQYRSEQQDLSNLSKYVNGQTPEAQFGQLSGAASGPTPTTPNVPQPGVNFNAGTQGANAALNAYDQQTQQASPWMAGLSGVLGAANVASSLGFKPLA